MNKYAIHTCILKYIYVIEIKIHDDPHLVKNIKQGTLP